MITIDGKQFRNLEEQVLKNKEDIAKHYQAMQLPLNLAGIEVIGSITDPSQLDGVIGEKFGDAYVQVVGDDTYLWIWTRSNPDAGEDEAYWLDIPFTTVGEQGAPGPQGEQGPQGNRGSLWYVGNSTPGYNANYRDGDMYLNYSTGNVYRFRSSGAGGYTWEGAGNIRGPRGFTGSTGPQGPQGPKGERGSVGPQGPISPGIVIYAILNSVDELPTPTELNNLSAAYIVNGDLYIQVGSNTYTAVWTNMGSFTGGTTVFKNGDPVITWNANTKLDVPEGLEHYERVNVVPAIELGSGTRRVIPFPLLSGQPEDGAIPYYNEHGCLASNFPVDVNDVLTWHSYKELSKDKIIHTIVIQVYDENHENYKYQINYRYMDNLDVSFIDYLSDSSDLPYACQSLLMSLVGQVVGDYLGNAPNGILVVDSVTINDDTAFIRFVGDPNDYIIQLTEIADGESYYIFQY